MSQLTYTANPAVGFSGMIAEGFTSPKQVDSKLAEVAAVQFGTSVEEGSDAASQVITLATLANWSGIAIAASNVEVATGASGSYAVGVSVPVMTRGRVFVIAGGVVAVGDRVEPATGVGGKFSTVAVPTLGLRIVAVAVTAAAADDDLLEIEISTNPAAGQPLA